MTSNLTARTVQQPGTPGAVRAVCVDVGTMRIDAELPAGVRLLDALAALLADGDYESACLRLSGGAFGPFAYMIPALSPDGKQAAFYSAPFRPGGATALESASVTVGLRGDAPFFHCHAVWTAADGVRGCGHVLPDETFIAQPIRVRGAGIIGARFEVEPDVETGFSLFVPRESGTPIPAAAVAAVAVRLAPNQDLVQALEGVGRAAGFDRAVVQGGVASIIGARFADGGGVPGFATEMLVTHGLLDCSGATGSEVDVVIVDLNGVIGTGRLIVGDNPVLMTFEGLVEQA